MPSRIPPVVIEVNDQPFDVTKLPLPTGTTVTFKGEGVPSYTIKIKITNNGVASPPAVSSIVVGPDFSWTVKLDNLPPGDTVVEFTEESPAGHIITDPGTVKVGLLVTTSIIETFDAMATVREVSSVAITTPNRVNIYTVNGFCGIVALDDVAISSAIKNLFATDNKGKIEGMVLYLKSQLNLNGVGYTGYGCGLRLLGEGGKEKTFSKVSFWCRTGPEDVFISFGDSSGNNGVGGLTVPKNTLKQIAFIGPKTRTVVINNTVAGGRALLCPVVLDSFEFTAD